MMIDKRLGGSDTVRDQIEGHRRAMYRVAFAWCHDAQLADDLVQDSMLKALSSRAQLRDPARLLSWLFAILGNCFRDHLRAARSHDDIDLLADKLEGDVVSPEEACAGAQIAHRVRAAVATLPLGQRQVLTLVDLEGLGYAEVAEVLGIPIGTVMSRLCRARGALRGRLVKERIAADVQPIRSVR